MDRVNVRRVLLSVSDKNGIVELAQAFHAAKAELVATGKTAKVLEEAGLPVTPIEKISGSPEAFRGRMKTLSFPVCSGILYRRGDVSDETDLEKLKIQPIDCVVVNFYPFEEAVKREGATRAELIEEIDIGGPTLVRAAAKNAPDVLILTSPAQYGAVIEELEREGNVSRETTFRYAAQAWDLVRHYDSAIADKFGAEGEEQEETPEKTLERKALRYGENPHQKAWLEVDAQSPIAWDERLTSAELSYNNILDLSAAYALASDLAVWSPESTGVVIVKHNNPCGVAVVPRSMASPQKTALIRAWEGDPVSAFGGVLVFTHPIEKETAEWLRENFIELVAAPGLNASGEPLQLLTSKRKNLKAVRITKWGGVPAETSVTIPGGKLIQTSDVGVDTGLKSVTEVKWPEDKKDLAQFGIFVCRSLKSNAITLVRALEASSKGGGSSVGPSKGAIYQLVGAGQGQPNRIDALKSLAVPRAQGVLDATEGKLEDCVMVSDAFFPFRDTVDAAHAAGIRAIIQPGGSLKDEESIKACNEHGIAMVFTGIRHFRH